MPFPLKTIFFDVISACNLRCPFCLTDWSEVTPVRSNEEVVKRVIPLAKYTPRGGTSLSCRYEPTMHPHLEDIIKSIPAHLTEKFFFTTNLTIPLKDSLLETIATSGFDQINISLDSCDPQRYMVLRKNGRYDVFLRNADRLKTAFDKIGRGKAPKISVISVALKSNLLDLPEVTRFAEDLGAFRHEVRYLYNKVHIPADFMRREIPDESDWDWLCQQSVTTPLRRVFRPDPGYRYDFQNDSSKARPEKMNLIVVAEGDSDQASGSGTSPTLLPLKMASTPLLTPHLPLSRSETICEPPTVFIDPDGRAFTYEGKGGFCEVSLMKDGTPENIIKELIDSPHWDDIEIQELP